MGGGPPPARRVDARARPYVDDATTWAERRALYAELLAKPDSVLLLATVERRARRLRARARDARRGTWAADTWVTGPRIGEIESLAVLPEHRGRGLGTELLDRLERELRAQGVTDLVIGALPGNEGAVRMYERRGYRPTWMYLSRFDGR